MTHLLHPFQFLVIAVFGSMHGRQLLLNDIFGKRIESYVNSSAREATPLDGVSIVSNLISANNAYTIGHIKAPRDRVNTESKKVWTLAVVRTWH